MRVATALAVEGDSVNIDRAVYSLGLRSLRCWGSSAGVPFFAKILAADPYPIQRCPAIPIDAPRFGATEMRSAQDQVQREWTDAQAFRKWSRSNCVTAPLGVSPVLKIIVWEQAMGTRLRTLVEHSSQNDPGGALCRAAMFETGRWLRGVHESTLGTEVLDLSAFRESLPILMATTHPAASKYLREARNIFEKLCVSIGSTTISTPVVACHGDLSLGNLMWDPARRQLHVVDFEHYTHRSSCYDLAALISSLRSELLNPLIPLSLIQEAERALWAGYGPVPAEIVKVVNAFASSRIFYYSLPRMLTRRQRKGWRAGIAARTYRFFCEDFVVRRLAAAAAESA